MIESEIESLARVQEVKHGGMRKLLTKVKNELTEEDDGQTSKDKMKGALWILDNAPPFTPGEEHADPAVRHWFD